MLKNTYTTTLIIVLLLFANKLISQEKRNVSITSELQLKAYFEAYYGYDFGKPENQKRPAVFYNFTDHNQFSLNTGMIGLNYSGKRIRSNLSFILGSYAQENLSGEPKVFNHIYEANLGVKLLKKHEFWLDVGIMESNLGFESAMSANCYTLTRTLLAESSPFYLNAAKLSYLTQNNKWEFEFLFSNGWQQMVHGYPSFGHTVKYKPNENWLINSSSFLGRVKLPGAVPLLTRKEYRIFHNFYAKYEKDKIGIIGGIDFGVDQLVENNNDLGSWVGIAGIFRYQFHKNWSATIRGEYYLDPSNSVAQLQNIDGLESFGGSLNVDCHLGEIFMIRVEGRILSAKKQVFELKDSPSNHNLYVGVSGIIDLWN
ncbi:outer membrane beta-barrel protein [Brumimicrobium salinarum]|nr:outer membrane beta-barrel protein [Brumimicrobium salinarum]